MPIRASAAQHMALGLIHYHDTHGSPIAAGPASQDAPTAWMTAPTWAVLLRNGWVEFYGEPIRYGHRAVRLTDAGRAQLTPAA